MKTAGMRNQFFFQYLNPTTTHDVSRLQTDRQTRKVALFKRRAWNPSHVFLVYWYLSCVEGPPGLLLLFLFVFRCCAWKTFFFWILKIYILLTRTTSTPLFLSYRNILTFLSRWNFFWVKTIQRTFFNKQTWNTCVADRHPFVNMALYSISLFRFISDTFFLSLVGALTPQLFLSRYRLALLTKPTIVRGHVQGGDLHLHRPIIWRVCLSSTWSSYEHFMRDLKPNLSSIVIPNHVLHMV